jgi:hypothetical protein
VHRQLVWAEGNKGSACQCEDGVCNVCWNTAADSTLLVAEPLNTRTVKPTRTAIAHLYPGLCETNPHGDLLPHEDIRVVRLGEAALQLVQLRRREAGSMSLLLRRFVRVRGRAWRQALLLLLACLLRRKAWRLTQRRCSQAT